ncbi:MAG: putative nucleotide-diphospho-sugar transferase [Aggregatilineales bacterium]
MRLCITTAFDENYAPLGDLCVRSLHKYASAFGHDVHVERMSEADLGGLDPVWARIPIVLKLFDRGYDFVVWTDCDTLFVRTDRDIAAEIFDDKHLYLIRQSVQRVEMPGVICLEDKTNSGFFLIRNCDWSREFLTRWYALRDQFVAKPRDNGALYRLLGYHHLLNPNDKNQPNDDVLRYVRYITPIWSSIINVPNVLDVEDSIVFHFAAYDLETRLKTMQQVFRDYIENQPALSDRVTIDFQQPFIGWGWQEPELFQGRVPFRWMARRDAWIPLYLLPDRDYRLHFLVFDSLSLAVRNSLELQLNGVRIPLTSALTDGVTRCTGILPRAVVDRRAAPARLSFHIMHTLCPFELNPDHLDRRQLGVALGGVEIAPVDALDVDSTSASS